LPGARYKRRTSLLGMGNICYDIWKGASPPVA
jgi:hypothetical protein